jgi:putative transcriptional regulator
MKIFPFAPQADTHHQIKAGKVLIARKCMNDELLNKSVILLLEHDETGSTGIILNKCGISSELEGSKKDELICYGGTYDTHRVGVILDTEHLAKRAIKIAEGIYYSENCSLFQEKNFKQAIHAANLKAYIGFTVWQAGQLEQEIDTNKWWIDEFSTEDLKTASIGLWEHRALKLANKYGLFYNSSEPLLN